ncbi:hypothetical protein PG995_015045 [Apiospora arundinis]
MGDSGSSPDINVSNGTCYYTEHMQTKGNFIACGNVAFGHWPCCQAGDMCLSLGNANACWDSDNDVGEAAARQLRSVLLVDPLLKGASALPAFASLPSSAGGSIKWTSDFNPTATAAGVKPANATATSKSSPTPSVSPPSASATTPPTATATSSSPAATATSSDDSGLTVGAKAGIGVGAAGAALLIVAVMLLALLVRRRKQRKNNLNNFEETHSSHPHRYDGPLEQHQQEQVAYYSKTPPPPTMATTNVRPMLNSQDSQPYVGYKAELSADDTQQRRPWDQQTGYKSELAADETTMPRNEIGSSAGGNDEIQGANSWSRGGGEHRRGSNGTHATPVSGGGGGGGLSPYPSSHPSSAATAHSPFSTYSDVSTLYASSGSGGGTGRGAPPPPPTPPQQHQQRTGEPSEQEWPLSNGPGAAQMQSFRDRQQGRGTWRSHGYDPS